MNCTFCDKIIEKEILQVYNVLVVTNKNYYMYGIPYIIEELSKWLFKKSIKLSATEILLLRPDVYINYLNEEEFKEEKVILFTWIEYIICTECYNNEYKLKIPLQ